MVRAQIAATGTYTQTHDEVCFGAKVAWRNASKCIGRLYWRSLVVLDRRCATGAEHIFALLLRHLRQATGASNPGQLRPVISIFPPVTPGRPYPRIWNEQLIRYAGYRRADGSVVKELSPTPLVPGPHGMSRFAGISLARLPAGDYDLIVTVTDEVRGETVTLAEAFAIAEPQRLKFQ